MKPEEKIRELIRKSDVTTSPETNERILGDALEHLKKLKQKKLASESASTWRTIMKSSIARFAVAAAIFIAFGIGFSIGRWSKPTPPLHSLDVTSFTSAVSMYPAAPKAEDSFWRKKALAATQPSPYAQTLTTKTSLLNTYKQYLKEKYYD